jgi:uncharacterized protein (TIGR00730 family)
MTDSKYPEPDHASIQAQLNSPSYSLAALDRDFLLSDAMRGVRFMLEYAKAEEILRKWRINSTIVVFGSARVSESEPGRRGRWYAEARKFGRLCSERSRPINGDGKAHRNVIATGGGPGVMEAANRGAFEAGAPSIGFNITLPHEQFPNPYTTPELTFQFHYFAMRKMHLAMRARALIVFPGGFGTFDELFELMTLVQTGKTHKLPILLFDKEFWSKAICFEALVEAGTISPEDPDLFCYANSAEEVWDRLVEKGLHMMPDEPHTV